MIDKKTELEKAKEAVVMEVKTPTSVDQIFIQHLPSSVTPATRKCNTDVERVMFTFEDVFKTSHPLARLLRMIFAQNNISIETFDKKHHAFAGEAGYLTQQINYNRNNIKKSINKPRVSYWMFEQVIELILGFTLNDITLKLTNPTTGAIEEYSLSDIEKKGRELFGDIAPTTLDVENRNNDKE